jgi:hypothetical protein
MLMEGEQGPALDGEVPDVVGRGTDSLRQHAAGSGENVLGRAPLLTAHSDLDAGEFGHQELDVPA